MGTNFASDLQSDFQRWANQIETWTPSGPLVYLSAHDVLRSHYMIAEYFVDAERGIAGVGPRSLDLLHSAVARQWTGFDGKQKWATKHEVVATLFFGIIKDHAFVDANKRTAFLSAVYHLEKMGLCPNINEQELEDFTVAVADDGLSQFRRFRELEAEHGDDGTIYFIAEFLRRNCRPIQNQKKFITYQQLNTILGRYGFELNNPKNNQIEVLKLESSGLFRKRISKKRIGSMGFPGWSKQVNQGELKKVREITQTDYKGRRIDNAAFFDGIDSIHSLITQYQAPLIRLADR